MRCPLCSRRRPSREGPKLGAIERGLGVIFHLRAVVQGSRRLFSAVHATDVPMSLRNGSDAHMDSATGKEPCTE